jgi:hypothetical protein
MRFQPFEQFIGYLHPADGNCWYTPFSKGDRIRRTLDNDDLFCL